MKLHTHHTLSRLVLICCGLMLTLLIAACNTSGQGTTAIPTPTPTPAPALTTYNSGEGYTIGYPKGWTYKKYTAETLPTTTFIGSYIKSFSAVAGQAAQQVPITTLTDSLGANTLTIGVIPNPSGAIPTQTALNVATTAFQSSVKNYKKASIASQATVGGQSWDETAATGNITQQGAIDAKTVALVSNHPAQSASTKLYFIVYAGPTSTFDNIDSTAFQPMLQSFKFS